MNRTIKRILYSLLVVVILFIIAYPKLNLSENSPSSEVPSGPPASRKMTVKAMTVDFQSIDYTVRVTGTIIADESVDLNSEVSAKIDRIHFSEGQNIKKGQLLVSLNDDELDAELEKLRFTVKLNEDNEFRQRKLLEKEAISREEYEVALTSLNTSLADIKLTEARKAKYQIYAPFDGKIGLREVSEGSYINPGDLIARLYSIDRVKIDFAIPGKYLQEINVGDELEFTVDGYDDKFRGEIYALEPQIDPQSRSIQLRAYSQNVDNKLLPGQFARINLILDQLESSMMVPTIALIPELNAIKVFVYVDGKVEERSVETGIRTEDMVQITNGLERGDVVITSGLLQIRQGMEVNIEN